MSFILSQFYLYFILEKQMEQLLEVKELESRYQDWNAQLTLTVMEGEDEDSKFYYTLVSKKGRKLEVTQNKRILILVLKKNKKYQLGYIEKVRQLPFTSVPQMKYEKELECIKHFYVEREILKIHFKDEDDPWQMVFQNSDLAFKWYQLIDNTKEQEKEKIKQNKERHSYPIIIDDQAEECDASIMLMLNKSKSSFSEKAEEMEREVDSGDKRALFQSLFMKEQVYLKNRQKMKDNSQIQSNLHLQLDILKKEIQEERDNREKMEEQTKLIKQMQAREEKYKKENQDLRYQLRKREEVESENEKLKKQLKELTQTSQLMLQKEVKTIFYEAEHKRYLQIQQQLFKQQIKTKELEWKYQRLESQYQQKKKQIQQLQEQLLQPTYPYDEDEDTSFDLQNDCI